MDVAASAERTELLRSPCSLLPAWGTTTKQQRRSRKKKKKNSFPSSAPRGGIHTPPPRSRTTTWTVPRRQERHPAPLRTLFFTPTSAFSLMPIFYVGGLARAGCGAHSLLKPRVVLGAFVLRRKKKKTTKRHHLPAPTNCPRPRSRCLLDAFATLNDPTATQTGPVAKPAAQAGFIAG